MDDKLKLIANKIFHAQCDKKQPCLTPDEWTEVNLVLCEVTALRRVVNKYDQAFYNEGVDPTIVVI